MSSTSAHRYRLERHLGVHLQTLLWEFALLLTVRSSQLLRKHEVGVKQKPCHWRPGGRGGEEAGVFAGHSSLVKIHKTIEMELGFTTQGGKNLYCKQPQEKNALQGGHGLAD